MLLRNGPDQIKGRIDQWAKDVAGTRPMRIPIYNVGPADRSIFNAQDFARQHGCTPIYGWAIHTSEMSVVIKAEYYGVVRWHGKTFSITARVDEDDMLFFEDPARMPVIEKKSSYELMYVYHTMAWPELNPQRVMRVVDPDVKAPVDIPMPETRQQKVIFQAPPAARPSAYKYSERNRLADEEEEVRVMVARSFSRSGH